MAVAKITCGACGAEIAFSDSTCPSCGVAVEHAGGAPQKSSHQQKPQQKPQQGKSHPTRKRPEPWTIISAVAIIALVAFLVYMELSKTGSAPASSTSGPAPQMPQQMQQQALPDLRPLQGAVDANPRDPGALIRLANGLHDNGLFPRAVETYKKYLAINPKDPDARVDMGICYYQMALADSVNAGGLFNNAIKEMSAAIAVRPGHQPAAFNLGIVSLHMGNIEESNRWLKRTVEINKASDLGVRAQQILDQHATMK